MARKYEKYPLKKVEMKMKAVIRKYAGKGKRTLSKSQIFKKTRIGNKRQKEVIFNNLIMDGYIFERRKGRWSYIG